MESESLHRLSQISTLRTIIEHVFAEANPTDARTKARGLLLERYWGAAYHYLLGALRDEEAAKDLLQTFAVRFMRGDFRGYDSGRGRFRDYLRKVLVNLVNDFHRERKTRPRSITADVPEPALPSQEQADSDPLWLESWREQLLTRTWAALGERYPVFFRVLVFHVQHPEMKSPELARQLNLQENLCLTATGARVSLHRARCKFEELLLDQVSDSLEDPSQNELCRELRNLGLLGYVRPALQRRGLTC